MSAPKRSRARIRPLLERARRAVRDGWLIVGVTLAMFAALEAAVRLYDWVAPAPTGDSSGSPRLRFHPYANAAWWPRFEQALARRTYRYDPYRAYALAPLTSPFLTIDSAGYRLTVQPRSGPTARVVLMLGGSTMWGATARDSFTIPSLVAGELARQGVPNVRVVNAAEPGYNSTQERITFEQWIAEGRRPDLVVLLSGFNDAVIPTWYRGEPGHTFEEARTARLIQLGKPGFWNHLESVGRASRLGQAVAGTRGDGRPSRGPSVEQGYDCAPIAASYATNARMTGALGRAEGIPVIYFLQPAPQVSRKAPTIWERGLAPRPDVRRCLLAIDSAMSRGDVPYLSLTGLFDQDTATVFVDADSHVTEAANAAIARRIADTIAPLLQEP